ncbi:MAG: type II toxin-antitoxin system RelE/ParE family toxin [Atopobiaceae bacterium]|nr:type II toxin-antitoxin system RelE/ParE family toxin [Atopobiaceae bacterium]
MSSSYVVSYTPAAQADVRAIYSYIANQLGEEKVARRQVNRIRQAIHKLHTMPERHKAVDWEPWASMGMRRMTIDNYVAFYQVNTKDKTVLVVRLFYGGRDIKNITLGERKL